MPADPSVAYCGSGMSEVLDETRAIRIASLDKGSFKNFGEMYGERRANANEEKNEKCLKLNQGYLYDGGRDFSGSLLAEVQIIYRGIIVDNLLVGIRASINPMESA